MKKFIFIIYIGLICACSSSENSSSSGSNNDPSGTNFLKFNPPAIAEEQTTSSQSFDLEGAAIESDHSILAVSHYKALTFNGNRDGKCIGAPGTIPFDLCMLEMLGIDSPGSYSGEAPNGENVTVIVEDLEDNPNGYDLSAVATNKTRDQIVFKYKANSDGTKGIIEGNPEGIFGENGPDYVYRIIWDDTVSPGLIESYSSEGSRNSPSDSFFTSSYLKALVVDGSADLVTKNYFFNQFMGIESQSRSKFAQIRVNSQRSLIISSNCEDLDDPTEGSECFNFSDSTLVDTENDSNVLQCFETDSIYYNDLVLSDAVALSNSTPGSFAFTENFDDSSCENLKNLELNESPFTIRLDKDDAASNSISGIAHEVRNKPWEEMNLIESSDFLE